MKVAIVHDHLTQEGGAEKVLRAIQEVFPSAPTYTLIHNPKKIGADLSSKDIRTSFLQKMPFGKKKYQWYLPLMPVATESYDLSEYDVVISSSSAFAKGVITSPDTIHICYCHTPTRYLWTDTHEYVQNLKLPKFIKRMLPPVLSRLRQWDRLAADRVDYFLVNSETVKKRVKNFYRKDSEILYPPVEIEKFSVKEKPGGEYFLAGGRLVAYKRFDVIVQAFNRLGMPLKIFGTGPELENLKKLARDHIEFLGYVTEEDRRELYKNARAFINPQLEDFGITPVEAMASGTPVIAYGKGGALETIIDGVTGLFFYDQRWEEIADIVIRLNDNQFDPQVIHRHAQKFSKSVFKDQLKAYIKHKSEQSRN